MGCTDPPLGGDVGSTTVRVPIGLVASYLCHSMLTCGCTFRWLLIMTGSGIQSLPPTAATQGASSVSKDSFCANDLMGDSTLYRGSVNTTVQGLVCQAWDTQVQQTILPAFSQLERIPDGVVPRTALRRGHLHVCLPSVSPLAGSVANYLIHADVTMMI